MGGQSAKDVICGIHAANIAASCVFTPALREDSQGVSCYLCSPHAGMAELVDATDLKSVEV